MEKQKEGISLKIHEIKEISFSSKVNDEIVNDFDDEKLELKLGYSVQGDYQKESITLGVMVAFNSLYTNEPIKFIQLETATTFHLFNSSDDDIRFLDDNNEIFINDGLMSVFLSTAIGATRGMLAYKMASLPINICLPLFDLEDLIPDSKSEANGK